MDDIKETGNINPHVLTSQSISQQVLLSILIRLVNAHSLAHTPTHTGCNYWAHTALTSATTAPSCDQKVWTLLSQHCSFLQFTEVLQNTLIITCYFSKWPYMRVFHMSNTIFIFFNFFVYNTLHFFRFPEMIVSSMKNKILSLLALHLQASINILNWYILWNMDPMRAGKAAEAVLCWCQ